MNELIEATKPQIKEVRYQHFRIVWGDGSIPYLIRSHEWKERGLQPEPRGGLTTAKVVFEDGSVVNASAECSKKDNYSKQIGRDIALGRALRRKTEREEIPW